MRARLFQIDAFTTKRFHGNPAAVMLMPWFPKDAEMLAIAAENNLSETAFLVRDGDDYRIRWFTPKVEVPLCGHATLASAAVVMERLEPTRRHVVFHSASGPLPVRRTAAGYALDFPVRPSRAVATPALIIQALAAEPIVVHENQFNYLAVLSSETQLRKLRPDFDAIRQLDRPGLIVTARSLPPFDFTSRYFAPAKGLPEDPVTGGAHCMLAPYWAGVLGKSDFRAWQASARGGELFCRLHGERVELEGACVFYFEGDAEIDA